LPVFTICHPLPKTSPQHKIKFFKNSTITHNVKNTAYMVLIIMTNSEVHMTTMPDYLWWEMKTK